MFPMQSSCKVFYCEICTQKHDNTSLVPILVGRDRLTKARRRGSFWEPYHFEQSSDIDNDDFSTITDDDVM